MKKHWFSIALFGKKKMKKRRKDEMSVPLT